ncbi:hypothetical protein [Streptomyces sp. NPDC046887]|uniref:hypothetical protein n=1 Tax=Streptomyces sp. NPDC046887 TaxID=3155472 RepID=UPI0033E7D302
MIRDLLFTPDARGQFEVLPKRQKKIVGKALLKIAQETDPCGGWWSKDEHRLSITYVLHRGHIPVTAIAAGAAEPAGRRQPYQGAEMRYVPGNGWIHLNPHQE